MKTLYTIQDLYELGKKEAFSSAAQHLNDHRLSGDFDYDAWSHHYEAMIENLTEKLWVLGFDAKEVHIYDDRGLDVSIKSSLDFIGDAIPYSFLNFVKEHCKYESREMNESDKEIFIKSKLDFHWQNSFLKKILSDKEIQVLDELLNVYDYSVDFEVFDSYSYPLTLDIYKNNDLFNILEMLYALYHFEDKDDILSDFELSYLVASSQEDPDETLEPFREEILKAEKHFFTKISDSIEQKGKKEIEEIINSFEQEYRDLENWFYSIEFFEEDLIHSSFDYYSDFLFDSTGNFICKEDDLEDEEDTIQFNKEIA